MSVLCGPVWRRVEASRRACPLLIPSPSTGLFPKEKRKKRGRRKEEKEKEEGKGTEEEGNTHGQREKEKKMVILFF